MEEERSERKIGMPIKRMVRERQLTTGGRRRKRR
jgi:hypothetical protein